MLYHGPVRRPAPSLPGGRGSIVHTPFHEHIVNVRASYADEIMAQSGPLGSGGGFRSNNAPPVFVRSENLPPERGTVFGQFSLSIPLLQVLFP